MDQPQFRPSTDAASQSGVNSTASSRRLYALFYLGSEALAVEAAAIQRFSLMARLSTPGGLPSILKGFLNFAGQLIPIINLHRILDLPAPVENLYTQILILRSQEGPPFGWIVDRVAQVLALRRSDLTPVPEGACFKEYTTDVFTLHDRQVPILAPERILLQKERLSVDEFRSMEEARLRQLELSAP